MNQKTLPLRILICDDDDLICESLEERLLYGKPPFPKPLEVLTCLNAQEALAQIPVFQPNLVLMDLVMPYQALSGIDVLEALAAHFPDITKIVLTSFGKDISDQDIHRLRNCQLNGFVAKVSPGGKHCLDYCYDIWQGSPYFEMLYRNRVTALSDVTLPVLTPRQREVLVLRAQGNTVPVIAEQLALSETSVKTHLKRIQAKLGTAKASDLFAYAQKQHWL